MRLLGLALLVACGPDPVTQTVVFIHADPSVGVEGVALRITVFGEGEVVAGPRVDLVDRAVPQLARLPLVPAGGVDRTWEILAELVDAAEAPVRTLRVAGGYVAGETREIRVWFDEDVACTEDCGEGRTCAGGRCVGACHVAREAGSSVRDQPACGECEICGRGECLPSEDTTCSCGGTCSAGTCRPALSPSEVWAGEHQTCVSAGGLWCWGHNWAGRVGLESDSDVPVQLTDELSTVDVTFRSIIDMAMGADHTCAFWAQPGPVFLRTCWGWNGGGALGLGTVDNGSVDPTQAPAGDPAWLLLSAGRFSTCGLSEEGEAFCWGRSNRGQLGVTVPVGEASGVPVRIDERDGWTHLDAGNETVCGIIDGRIECWGAGRSGELGDGGRADRNAPACAVDDDDKCLEGFERVSVGNGGACALDLEGRAWCWGNNEMGRLGVPGGENVTRPRRVDTDLRFRILELGPGFQCGIDVDDGLWCWGLNRDSGSVLGGGFLGVGDLDTRTRPARVEVTANDRWRSVSTGFGYACGIREAGDLYCWGSNDWSATASQPAAGRLGLGLGTNSDESETARTDVLLPRQVCLDR